MQTPPPETAHSERIAVLVGGELIGDAFYKIPVLFALRNAYPRGHITWIATEIGTAFAGTLRSATSKLIDEVIEHRPIGYSWSELREPQPGPFDIVIDTRSKLGLAIRTRFILKPRLFIARATNFLVSDRRPGSPLTFRKPPHIVDRLLLAIQMASGSRPDISGSLDLPEDARKAAAVLLPERDSGIGYVGFVPGAGGRFKCWPLDRYIEVARFVASKGAVPVFLLGPDEMDWIDTIRASVPEAILPEQDRTDPYPHIYGWPLVVALGERLRLAIANDCGTSHMLGAAQTPMINLFGPTSGVKFQPKVPNSRLVEATAFGSTDMAAIPTEEVIKIVQEMLPQVSSPRDRGRETP